MATTHQIAVFRNVEAIDEHGVERSRETLGAGLGLVVFVGRLRALSPSTPPADACGERLKSFMPTNNRPRLTHALGDDRFLDPPDVGFRKRRPPTSDLIQIAACDGIVPRESGGHNLGREDVDVGRQSSLSRPGSTPTDWC